MSKHRAGKMKPVPVAVFPVLAIAMVALSGCIYVGIGFHDDGGIVTIWPEPYTIAISVESVTPTSVRLAVTSDFNASDVPVYRNGLSYGRVELVYGSTTVFVDPNVDPGGQYSYQVGGTFFPMGEVWSNVVTVVVP